MIKGPTRITRQTKTLIDMAFTNKPEHITRTYNLITGLSDHNMILTVRKLTRKRLQYFGKSGCDKLSFIIPEAKTVQFERELNNLNWEQIMAVDDVDECCNSMTTAISGLIDKFLIKKDVVRKTLYHG